MPSDSRRVLHVEDDALNRSLMEHVVALVPRWELTGAATLAAARDVIDAEVDGESTIDLVLVDLDLPDGGGDDLIANLRHRGCRAPIWVITGDAAPTTAERLSAAGVERVLVKPFDVAALIADLAALA